LKPDESASLFSLDRALHIIEVVNMDTDNMPIALRGLNPEQRRAVQHGVKVGSPNQAGPLLVIAGAGTGKTKTLSHSVAHLIVNGADPHRILLLTFSRRAAVEMTRRVERITAAAVGTGQADLPWSGTFHAKPIDFALDCLHISVGERQAA
jgi:hypothetical protein